MAKYVLGLDFGTSTLHCLLEDDRERVVAQAEAPLDYFCPEGGPPLAREFDPERVWAALGSLVRQVCGAGKVNARQVSAIGLTSQGQGTVLLDKNGKELYCGPNIDLRAVFEGASLDEQAGEEIYRLTGHSRSMLTAPARLRWLQAHQPGAVEAAGAVLPIAGWMARRMTGQGRGSPGLGCGLGISGLDGHGDIAPLLQRLGFPGELLPHQTEAGAPFAALTPGIGEDWGIPGGTPVTLADADNLAGIMGMGLASPGETGILLGWSGSVQILTESAKLDTELKRTWVDPYPLRGLRTVQANLGDVGRGYSWLLRTIGGGLTYAEAEVLAAQASPGSDGVVTILGPGPLTAPNAGLRLGGIIFPTPLTFQEADTGQIIRSYLESVAYSAKANLETASQVSGHDAPRVYLGGALSRSDVLAETLCSLLETPIYRSVNPQVSALGACGAAWAAADRYRDICEAVRSRRPEFDVFEPDPALTVEYRQHYRRWLDIYAQVSPPR